MEFLKKHYEKLILSVVLLGLAAAAALLPVKVSQEKQKEEERKQSLIGKKATPFPALDLSTNKAILDKVKNPIRFDLAGKHNLFNPVRWEQKPNGEVIKIATGSEVGLGALEITGISPLNLVVTFDEVTGTGENLRYQISVTRETEKANRKNTRLVAVGAVNPLFSLKSIQGSPEAPTELTVVLQAETTPVVISKENPHRRVIGQAADMKYEPLNLTWKTVRVKDSLTFGGETYNIVAITPEEVILSAKSNGKQTTKRMATVK